jgi:hypothetical protein
MDRRTTLLWLALFSSCGGLDASQLSDGGGTATGGGSASAGGGGGSVATGGGGGSASTCTDTWAAYGETFFVTNCSSCHEHTGQFSQAAVQASLASIVSQIDRGRMPQGFSLSTAEKARVLAYLACGAP